MLQQSCSGQKDVTTDDHGFSQCSVPVWAKAVSAGMAASLLVEAHYTLHIPPPLEGPVFAPSPSDDQVKCPCRVVFLPLYL